MLLLTSWRGASIEYLASVSFGTFHVSGSIRKARSLPQQPLKEHGAITAIATSTAAQTCKACGV